MTCLYLPGFFKGIWILIIKTFNVLFRNPYFISQFFGDELIDGKIPLDLKGQYAISLVGPDGYRLKTITVDSLPVEPAVDEPTPSVVQDEEFPLLWLILLLVAIAIIIAYSRRRKGKRK